MNFSPPPEFLPDIHSFKTSTYLVAMNTIATEPLVQTVEHVWHCWHSLVIAMVLLEFVEFPGAGFCTY